MEQTSGAIEEVAKTAEELNSLAQSLNQEISKLKFKKRKLDVSSISGNKRPLGGYELFLFIPPGGLFFCFISFIGLMTQ